MPADVNHIKVVVRVRPPIKEDYENEFGEPFKNVVRVAPERSSMFLLSPAGTSEREFRFDKVFDSSSDQDDVYSTSSVAVVSDVLQGMNGAILAYGQTGTGKTFTIFGPGSDWERPEERRTRRPASNDPPPFSQCGIVPRAILQVFDYIEANSTDTEFRVTVSFMQIYMETIMDLLDCSKVNLSIREDPKSGVFVDSLTQLQVDNPAQVLDHIREGAANRAISSTAMNKTSSRSHVILQLTIEQRSRSENGAVRRGTLSIVDLAGSERVSKTGSDSTRLEEAKKINKSLSALGNVVQALTAASPTTHIPFRDSKLTRLLSDSLGGNSKTCLVVCVGPAAFNYEETYSSLHFATRAMAVKNHAVINEVPDFKFMQSNFEQKLLEYETHNQRLVEQNINLEREVSELKTTVANLSKSFQSSVILASPNEAKHSNTVPHKSAPLPHLESDTSSHHSVPPSFSSSPAESVSERLVGLTTPPQSRTRRIAALTSSPLLSLSQSSFVNRYDPERSLMSTRSSLVDTSSLLSIPAPSLGQSWEEREKELILHFSRVVSDLTEKLERYKWLSDSHSNRYSEGKEATLCIEKLCDLLMKEDLIRRKVMDALHK
ncbi:hypothetical protein RCL1_000958 [Eukaryota sp. TZLM3-RCL]